MGMGGLCGAVTGALMVIGLRYGGSECVTKEGRAFVKERSDEFIKRFRERNLFLDCTEFLGCDCNTPEGKARVKELDLRNTVCVPLVESAAVILREMADEDLP